MAANLETIRSYVGTGLPYVFIDRIIIQDGNMRLEDVAARSNELNFIKNKFGVNKFVLEVGEEDEKHFSNTNIYSVDLDISVKDFFMRNSWFGKVSDLNIKIIQSTHPFITKLFKSGTVTDIGQIEQKFKLFVSQQILPIPKQELSHYKQREMTDIGDTLCKIPTQARFIANSQHLTYFAFVFQEDTELEGAKTIQRVFESGRKKETATCFYMPNGEIWSGPVHHLSEQGWMAGATHSSRPHSSLKRVEHFNTKIQDLRVFDKLAEAQGKILLSTENIKNKRIFSDLYTSRDKHGAVRGLFVFDPVQILRLDSKYGILFKHVDNEKLMQNSFLQSINVIREKIEKKNILDYDYEDQSNKEEMVAYASSNNTGKLGSSLHYVDENKDGKLDTLSGGVKEISLAGIGTKKCFSFYDSRIKDLESGKYTYRVELSIKDPTIDYFEKLLADLRFALRELEEYHSLINRPVFYNRKTTKFTRKFFDFVRLRYSLPTQLGEKRKSGFHSPWRKAARAYLRVLEALSGPVPKRVRSDLFAVMAPSSGTLTGVELFFKLAEKMLVNFGVPAYPSANSIKNTRIGNTRLSTIIRISHLFDSGFDASIIKNYGFNYMENLVEYNASGLPTISRKMLRDRFKKESKRFGYSIPRSGTKPELKKYYSTLSPIGIDYSVGSINLENVKSVSSEGSLYSAHASLVGVKKNPGARSFSVPADEKGEGVGGIIMGYMDAFLGEGAGLTIRGGNLEAGGQDDSMVTATDYLSEDDKIRNKPEKKDSETPPDSGQTEEDLKIITEILADKTRKKPDDYVQTDGAFEPKNKVEEDIFFNSFIECEYVVGFDNNLDPIKEDIPVESKKPFLMVSNVRGKNSFVEQEEVYDSSVLVYEVPPREEKLKQKTEFVEKQEPPEDSSQIIETPPPDPPPPENPPYDDEPEPSADAQEAADRGAEEEAIEEVGGAVREPSVVIREVSPRRMTPTVTRQQGYTVGGGNRGY